MKLRAAIAALTSDLTNQVRNEEDSDDRTKIRIISEFLDLLVLKRSQEQQRSNKTHI